MKFKGELLVALASAGFSLMPVFAKFAYAGGASVGTVLLFRFVFAVIFIWSYIFIKKIEFRINLKQVLLLGLLGGVLYFACSISLFISFKYISAGLAEVLMFTFPAWVLVISHFIFKERLHSNKLFAILCSICGVILVSYAPGMKFNPVGIIFALLAALTYAFYVTYMGHASLKDIHSMVMTGYILLFSAMSFLIYGLLGPGIKFDFQPQSWVYIMLLAILSTSVAILSFCIGVKIIGATKAAIISNVEPIMTFTSAYLFLNEKVTLMMFFGAALIIGAITFINVFKEKETDTTCLEA